MKYVALISETDVGYREQSPFHGSRQYTLLGLYAPDLSGTVDRMMKQQRGMATSRVERREFEGQAAVDDIALDLAKKNGIFHGAVSGKVGYVAFKDSSEAMEIFNSL